MKKTSTILWVLTLMLTLSTLIFAQDKRIIKPLINKYEQGQKLTDQELESILPFLEKEKIILQNHPFNPKNVKATIMSEDFSGGALPAGWTNVDALGTNIWEFNNPGGRTINTTTNANGFAILDSDNYGGGPEESSLITAPIDCSGNTTVKLDFEHYFKSGYSGTAEVLVSGDNGSTWTSFGSWSSTSTANAESVSYDISAVAAGQSQVLVKWYWTGDYSWYWAVDDITVYEPSTNPTFDISPASKDFGTVNLTQTSAAQTFTISNTGGGTLNISSVSITGTNTGDFNLTDGNTYPVALGAGASITVDVSFSPQAAGARSANLRVVADAKVDHDAALSGTGNDATVTSFPYNQDFENAGSIPTDWSQDVANAEDWLFGTSATYGASSDHTSGSGYFAWIDDSSPHDANPASLISPPLDISGLSTPTASFFYWIGRGNGRASTIHVDVYNGSTWTNDVITALTEQNGWAEATVDLSSYKSTATKVRFRGVEDPTNYDSDISLDDFSVYDNVNPPSCTNVDAPADAATDVSVGTDLTWSSGGGSPTGYKIYFGTDGGGTTDPTNIENGTDLGNVTTYTPGSSLQYSTTYYWKIVAYNANGDATGCSIWSFTTEADPTLTPPFTETFASYLPNNWTEGQGTLAAPSTITGTTSSWTQDDYRNDTGDSNGKSAKINIYGTTSSNDEWLFTPPVDLGDGTTHYQLEFDLALTDFGNSGDPDPAAGSDDKFAVIISTDNGTTWSSANALQIWDNTTTPAFADIPSAGQHITLDLTSYSGVVKFGFYGESTVINGDMDLFVDNVQVREIPTSPIFDVNPTSKDFGTVNLTQSSAAQTFTVTNTGSGTLTVTSATITGTNSGDFSISNAPTFPQNLTNGQSFTLDVTFTPQAAGARSATLRFVDNTKANQDVPLSGTGNDATVTTYPYTEDFETFTPGTDATGYTNDWSTDPSGTTSLFRWNVNEGSTPSSSTGPDQDYNPGTATGNYLFTESSSGAQGDIAYVYSPPFDLSSLTTPSVTFYYHMYGATMGNLYLDISTDGGSNWTNLVTISGEQQASGADAWLESYTALGSYAGQSVSFRFRGEKGSSYTSDMAIDNFIVKEAPATPPDCATLVSPADGATDVAASTTLEWVSGGGGPTGYKIYFGTDGGGTSDPTNVENGTDLGNATTYVPASDLQYSTTYYWKIVAYNANGDATGCQIWSFTTEANPNSGGDGTSYGGYYWSNSTSNSGNGNPPTYNWIDPVTNGHTQITSWTDDGATGGDDSYFTATMPFNFNFFGTSYNTVYINSNGALTFGTAGQAATGSTLSIPNATDPDNLIAGCMMDLDNNPTGYTTEGTVYYGTTGGEFIVTWYHYYDYSDANEWITFQIILKPSGNIKIQYNQTESQLDAASTSSTINGDALIGIENADGSVGIEYRNNGSGGPIFDPAKASNMALEFGQTESNLPVELSSFNANLSDRDVSLSWETATEVDAYSFQIERAYIDESRENEFFMIGEVMAAGNSNSPKKYSFVDEKLNSGNYQYRLKMIDTDGSYEYSDIVEIEVELPMKYSLGQNYPNPFNPSTKIEYSIPEEAEVKIILYNIMGEVVGELVNGKQEAGFYTLNVDMAQFQNGLASGIYLYRMIAINKSSGNTFVNVKKMILLK